MAAPAFDTTVESDGRVVRDPATTRCARRRRRLPWPRTSRERSPVDIRDSEPDWAPYLAPKAPDGAPNVLVIVWDDVGYGTMECFGGPVRTPAMSRIADMGIRYSNFHTTALCSPTRASLLTGRNGDIERDGDHRRVQRRLPGDLHPHPVRERVHFRGPRRARIQHLLRRQVAPEAPGEETGMGAYKGRWPLGRGFERFYGFLGGESSCWYPDLIHDNHPVDAPAKPSEGYHIAKDLSDKAIAFIGDAKAVQPDKPFFMYLSLDAAHAPHHVFAEWADAYKGVFDEGYEAMRPAILQRQKELGLLPEDTELSPINPHGEPSVTGPDGQQWPMLDTVRPWATLTEDERRLFIRMAEVFAGYVSYSDSQLGRVLDFLEASGELDNTIIVAVSDNGASGEGGPNGTFNEWRFFNGLPTPPELSLDHIDELGSPTSYNHYNTGWAWAFDTPFPYWKRWAGYEGGVADMCAVAQPRHQGPRGGPRPICPCRRRGADALRTAGHRTARGHQGLHPAPDRGESFAASLTDAAAPGKSTQFYTMLGQRSIYHDGWLACTMHPPLSGWGNFEDDVWEVYNLAKDRAQCTDLAAQEPDRLDALKSLWSYYAGIYNGLPLDDRTALEQTLAERPHGTPERDRYVYYPDCAPVPEQSGVVIGGRLCTPSQQASTSPTETPRASCTRTAEWPEATAFTSKATACTTSSTGSAPTCKSSTQTGTSPRASTSSPRSSPRTAATPTRRCPAPPGHSRSMSTTSRWAAETSSPNPATSASSATESASDATTPHLSPPTTKGPSGSPAARWTKSSWTSRANATSTTRRKCAAGSPSTEPTPSSQGRRPPGGPGGHPNRSHFPQHGLSDRQLETHRNG
ncbi:sulfatase-like hydrolase/transferase [Yinghuangia aomiensis]